MPSFAVDTARHRYEAIVEHGILRRAADFLPASHGRIFVITTQDVWHLHGGKLAGALEGREYQVLYFPGGESNKRLREVETFCEEMARRGGDRSSLVIAFGGGIVTDLAGFTAAIFMRGIPVLQIPTTLLAQVDAAVGGKTGVNLDSGKNLAGSFHQPVAVLIDPTVLDTLSDREYRAGLAEVLKCGVIRDAVLFETMSEGFVDVLSRQHPHLTESIIAAAVRIKCEVVSADERESGLRRILNFGHTLGHALEAETGYVRFLHGEAVWFGMLAASRLAVLTGHLSEGLFERIAQAIRHYGPIPPLDGISAESLAARILHDKKTIQGKVHFVLPVHIGETSVASGLPEDQILSAARFALQADAWQ